jgi:hypothetical protein
MPNRTECILLVAVLRFWALSGAGAGKRWAAAANPLSNRIQSVLFGTLDATNPLSPYPGLEVRWDHATSGGEVLSAVLPDAHVFKVQQRIEHPMHDC